MRYLQATALLCSIAMVIGCTYQTRSLMDPNDVQDRSDAAPRQFDNDWLEEHGDEVAAKAAAFIRERHPVVAADFPSIQIDFIDLGNLKDTSPEQWRSTEQNSIKLLHAIRDKVVGSAPSGEAWHLSVKARGFRGSEAIDFAFVPVQVAVCYTSVFMVCPGRASAGGVHLEATLDIPGEPSRTVAGAGYSSNFASTLIVMDNSDPKINGVHDQKVNALVAAIVSLADALVRQYEIERESRSDP